MSRRTFNRLLNKFWMGMHRRIIDSGTAATGGGRYRFCRVLVMPKHGSQSRGTPAEVPV
jgi:hypothetical protein